MAEQFELAKKMGKTAVLVKDSPGFVVNRVARHYYVEALKLMEENERKRVLRERMEKR